MLGLLSLGLVPVQEYDVFLSKAVESNPKHWIEFAILLVRGCMIDPKYTEGLTFVDLSLTADLLKKIFFSSTNKTHDKVRDLLAQIPDPKPPIPSGSLFADVAGRPQAFAALQVCKIHYQKKKNVFNSQPFRFFPKEWLAGYQQFVLSQNAAPGDRFKQLYTFFSTIYRQKYAPLFSVTNGALQSFFLHSIDLCVESVYTEMASNAQRNFSFTTIDAVLQLAFLLVRFEQNANVDHVLSVTHVLPTRGKEAEKDAKEAKQQVPSLTETPLVLSRLSAFLNSLLHVLAKDYDVKSTSFNERIYLRLFSMATLLIPGQRLAASLIQQSEEKTNIPAHLSEQALFELQVAMEKRRR